jgi:hypothetical protein
VQKSQGGQIARTDRGARRSTSGDLPKGSDAGRPRSACHLLPPPEVVGDRRPLQNPERILVKSSHNRKIQVRYPVDRILRSGSDGDLLDK